MAIHKADRWLWLVAGAAVFSVVFVVRWSGPPPNTSESQVHAEEHDDDEAEDETRVRGIGEGVGAIPVQTLETLLSHSSVEVRMAAQKMLLYRFQHDHQGVDKLCDSVMSSDRKTSRAAQANLKNVLDLYAKLEMPREASTRQKISEILGGDEHQHGFTTLPTINGAAMRELFSSDDEDEDEASSVADDEAAEGASHFEAFDGGPGTNATWSAPVSNREAIVISSSDL